MTAAADELAIARLNAARSAAARPARPAPVRLADLEREEQSAAERLDAARQRLAQARLDAAAAQPVLKFFDAASARADDPHWRAPWPGWQRFGGSTSQILEVLRPFQFAPAAIELADAKALADAGIVPSAGALKATALAGDRITVEAHQLGGLHGLDVAGIVKVSADQVKPPTTIRWLHGHDPRSPARAT